MKFANAISKRIEDSLISKFGFRNCIDIENAVMKNQKIDKCEQILYYNLKKYKQKGYFDILNNTSENVTLLNLMDYLGNVNYAISVVE